MVIIYVSVDIKVGLKKRGRYLFFSIALQLEIFLHQSESAKPTYYAVVILLITYGTKTKREM